jgi:Pyruvate/2-oxoglutarate dehydrogenase complex, dihydrolipoamide dehydrogenase (E3) component, and related enzymes
LDGFLKLIVAKNGTILGATIVGSRAGETIGEMAVAIHHKMKAADLVAAIHAYPTYATAVQQLTAEITAQRLLSGMSGRIIRGLSRLVR